MRTKYHFATVLTVIGLAVGMSGFGASPAAAADAGSSTTGSASASSSSETLQEILVSASRIDVDVMHAPVSVTAINGDDLQRNEIHNTTDLQFYVPGLAVANQVLNTGINIRGIGLGFALPNAAQGVPVYRDNLLVPPNAGDEPLWDLESVQVLRGPQGTLVGANSTGGAMFINSVKPTLGDNHGYMQLLGGNYHHLGVQSAVNLPLSETLAARVGLYYENRDSYSTNLSPPSDVANAGIPNWKIRAEPGNLNMVGVRGSLLWQPNDRVQVLARVNYFKSRSDYAAEKPIAIANTTINGVVTNCPAPGSYFNTNPTTWGAVPSACGNAPFAPADPYQLAYAVDTTAMNEQIWRESLESKIALTESGLTLRLLAGGSFNTLEFKNQHSASTNLTLAGGAPIHEHTETYEMDLVSPTEGPLTWVLGAFDWVNPATFAYRGTVYSGGPVGVGPGYAVPQGGFFLDFKSVKRSHALFGDLSYQLTPDLKAEFGVRETWNRNYPPFIACSTCPGGNANTIYFGGPNPVNPLGAVVFSAYGDRNAAGGFATNQGDEKDSFLTWKAALNYNLNATNYLYGLVATGGKAGGVSAQPGQFGQNFQPEKDTDFELGWKSTLLNGSATLQLNGFYTKYTNMQISDLNPQTGSGRVHNAGATNLYGVEFTGQAHVANWQLNATASYTKSSFDIGSEGIINQDVCALYSPCNNAQGQCPPGVVNGTNGCFDYRTGGLAVNGTFYPWLEKVNGLQLPNSPKFQYNLAVGYDFTLGNNDVLTPRVDYSYQGTQYAQIYNTPFDALPARHDLGLKLSYVHEQWYGEAYVTNVTSEVYPLAQNDADAQIYNAPRQWGIRLTRKF
jgi:iron complex outermembrane receptor protein